MTPSRVRIGDWTCPSGNNVVVFYRPVGDGFTVIDMEWDAPPPLEPDDEIYYVETIRLAVIARLREYTETTGRTLVLSP